MLNITPPLIARGSSTIFLQYEPVPQATKWEYQVDTIWLHVGLLILEVEPLDIE